MPTEKLTLYFSFWESLISLPFILLLISFLLLLVFVFFFIVGSTYLFIYRHLSYVSCVVTSLYRLEPGDSFGRPLLYEYELLPSFPPQTLSIVFSMSGIHWEG